LLAEGIDCCSSDENRFDLDSVLSVSVVSVSIEMRASTEWTRLGSVQIWLSASVEADVRVPSCSLDCRLSSSHSSPLFHPHPLFVMFTQSITEEVVNRTGAAADLRYFHTTYGHTFGYNERARAYHRSYGLVTPPTNPAYAPPSSGDLDTAPLFRRDHLGFRANYPERPFTWSESASKLTKNQKRYGDDDTPASPSSSQVVGALPARKVAFRATLRDVPAIPDRATPVTRAALARQGELNAQSRSQAQTERSNGESQLDREQRAWERDQAQKRIRSDGQRWTDDAQKSYSASGASSSRQQPTEEDYAVQAEEFRRSFAARAEAQQNLLQQQQRAQSQRAYA
jgi:hypothetical protein